MSDDLRNAVERALDKLGANMPVEAPPRVERASQVSRGEYRPAPRARLVTQPVAASHAVKAGKDGLAPEHAGLRGQWADVDMPDNAGEARCRIFAVTVRAGGRVRVELQAPDGTTVYKAPPELRNVGAR